MSVTDHALKPAATSCTGPVGMRRANSSVKYCCNAVKMDCFARRAARQEATCLRHKEREPTRSDHRRINRQHTIPIDTAQSSRLPPWEDFQRGPHERQAANSRPGPHRKSFTFPDVAWTSSNGHFEFYSQDRPRR